MTHAPAIEDDTFRSKDVAARTITPMDAMDRARAALISITPQPLDAIASCEASEDGWLVVLEVVEAFARMGNNDLLVPYILRLSPDGGLVSFTRGARYHREETTA